jgi:hypothetical protein
MTPQPWPASYEAGSSDPTYFAGFCTVPAERTITHVATSLDQKIAELEKIVEQRLELCRATWNGLRCTLPADHLPEEPHTFADDSPGSRKSY